MSLKKQMLKSKPVCKVTFRVSKEMAAGADAVTIVGDFNNWDLIGTPMKKLKTGEFTCVLELESGKAYEFRYLVGGGIWYNEPEADGYAANSFGSENSVLSV
ncbi:isoamylase early set domain-containing protein [Mangrovibacterium lignilyticum]|uniref:isoamylase early set domain-containing protein n=1 Tax=Mangrovibacterium lignilyticum TaxID=2668052 RepID=UPI0013D098E0|nr:isoamylase early set domain-containing protein [Mangrovibacterium lignilyticum]